jgi:pimeloyl-ACP methyl ester carboxylesterase
MPFDESSVTHRHADLAEVRLHYVEAGDGPLVVLLHGFPEHWYGWRNQILALAAAGHRVVAPDLRGYNLSDKPRDVRAYRAEALAADVAGLILAAGAERARVVGHDWGAGVAWLFAMAHPERLERLAVLNGPHPARLQRALLSSPAQLARSWYMLFFQVPWLPEVVLRARDHLIVRRSLATEPTRVGAFTKEDLDRYADALARPGALRGMINYYRAAARPSLAPRLARVDAPVLSIWGDRDPHLARELAVPGAEWVPNVRVERIPEASHWVQHDAPERVNQLLIDFLQ